MNNSEVKTTTHFIPIFLHIIICNPWIFLNWGLEVDVDILNFLAVFKRIFMDIYFTLLMSDNVGVRLISLFTMDFHKTSAFQ